MKFDWLTFWIAALACYRVTVLITRCLGPWDIFKRLRSFAPCSKLLSCPYCVSIYAGFLVCVALYFSGLRLSSVFWPLLSLAFSAVTIALDRVFSADHNP